MYEYHAQIVRIVDADTVDLDIDLGFSIRTKQRVRLAGIDAPERFTDEGKAATQWLREAINWAEHQDVLDYPWVTIRTEKPLEKGKYGRYIAHILFRDEDLSKSMVDAGHAVYRDY